MMSPKYWVGTSDVTVDGTAAITLMCVEWKDDWCTERTWQWTCFRRRREPAMKAQLSSKRHTHVDVATIDPRVASEDQCCFHGGFRFHGRNHRWKVEGDQGLGPNTGAQAPRVRPKAGLGVGCWRGLTPPAVRVRGITPGKFLKTQMLNPAFWWLHAVKFFAFWKLRPKNWGTNTLLVPQPKSWGPVSPGPYGCCADVSFSTQLWGQLTECDQVLRQKVVALAVEGAPWRARERNIGGLGAKPPAGFRGIISGLRWGPLPPESIGNFSSKSAGVCMLHVASISPHLQPQPAAHLLIFHVDVACTTQMRLSFVK